MAARVAPSDSRTATSLRLQQAAEEQRRNVREAMSSTHPTAPSNVYIVGWTAADERGDERPRLADVVRVEPVGCASLVTAAERGQLRARLFDRVPGFSRAIG